jgi:hypothetical protein
MFKQRLASVSVFMCGIAALAWPRMASADAEPAAAPVETPPVETSVVAPAPEANDGPVAPSTNPPAGETKGARVTWARSEPPASAASSEAEAAEAEPGAHLHDGLYCRVAFGLGHLNVRSEKGSQVTGWGLSPEVWVGGSPIAGLALGGTVGMLAVWNPEAAITAADSGGLGPVSGEARGMATYSSFGVFADYYPMPRAGLHLMTGINFSAFEFTPEGGETSQPATGIGVFGGLGYEWWASEQWSVGPLVRLHWASLSDASGGTNIVSPVFMLGVTNH